MEEKKRLFAPATAYTWLACCGSLQFGYGLACFNCMKETVQLSMGWSDAETTQYYSYLSTVIYVGAAIGSFGGGQILRHGRRLMNLILHTGFIAGALIAFFSHNFWALFLARCLTGLCVGFVTVTSPMIISETTPIESRGGRGVYHQLAVTIGIAVAIILGAPFNMKSFPISMEVYMRTLLVIPALSIIPVILMLTTMKDDTPVYYLSVRKIPAAEAMLQRVYQKSDVDSELRQLQASENADGAAKENTSWKTVFGFTYLKALLIGVGLACSQQITGINAFVSLSNQVFQGVGLEGDSLNLANSSFGLVNFVVTFPAIWLVEKMGRKSLLFWGSFGMVIFHGLVPVASIFGASAAILSKLAVVTVIGFDVCFAVSAGPVVWVMMNEMYPSEVSATACGIAAASNWLCGVCVVFIVSQLAHVDSKYIFGTFCLTSLLVTVFVGICVKETKGLTNAESPYIKRSANAESTHLLSSAA